MTKSLTPTGMHAVPEPNPFIAGQEAAKRNRGLADCPYVRGSHAWTRWLGGWRYQLRVLGLPEPAHVKERG